ncbi:MAG TPA: tetratricopeptide repeat protein, partial [Planctomycetota bacterium]
DVAPIVFARCAPCHRPGEAAPFALLTYEDVQKRAAQIVRVTEERFMPPWLPDSSVNAFQGDRSLREAEIATFRAWLAAGCPRGEPAALPPAPVFASGWQLGPPDRVVTMSEAYTVPAEGRDVYRNFVIPRPVEAGTRHVRALQFRPDNRAVLHHAILFVDGSGHARAEDRRDPEPGYESMGLGVLRPPNGQFVSWTPGKGAIEYEPGIAWTLDETLDVVLQLHLRPAGRPEPIRVVVGLYFADAPPTRHPLAIRLWSRDIDIPAGQADYVIEEQYTLPVDVSLHGVYPHAHYLGKDLRGWAVLPDGSEQALIHIPSWDFNWQEEYFYAEPLALPKGTVVHARYVYDNTAANPLNPHQPPRRVRYGFQSSDEMAELQLQVLTSEWDRPLLYHDFVQLSYTVDQRYAERALATQPANQALRDDVFKYCLRRRDAEGALRVAGDMLARAPDDPEGLLRLGQAQILAGQAEAAVATLARAIRAKPRGATLGRLHFQLGRAQRELGKLEEAQATLELVVANDPTNFLANAALGEVLARRGETEPARARLEAALARNPEHLQALWNLARLELASDRPERARELCARALEIAADAGGAHYVLGLLAEREGHRADAFRRFELATRFEPDEPAFAEARLRLADADPTR